MTWLYTRVTRHESLLFQLKLLELSNIRHRNTPFPTRCFSNIKNKLDFGEGNLPVLPTIFSVHSKANRRLCYPDRRFAAEPEY